MRSIRKFAIAGVSLLAFATPALAQEDMAAKDGEEATYEGNEIIVQARRRDESVQDVPAVVNAVTPEAIQKLNFRKLEDITAVVPGLTMSSNTNGIGSTTTIRGIQFDVNASGDNGTVQYYYNDAPVSSGVVLQGLYDIGQIEVLRGPQGTLKGRAAPSGSISIAFRKPDLSEAGGYAAGTVNDINGFNLNGAINVPVIEGKLAVRVAGLVSEDDGNRVQPVSGKADIFNRTRAGRVSVSADPFDGLLLLDFSYSTLNRKSRQFDQVQSVNQFGPTSTTGASPITIHAKDRLAVSVLPNDVEQSIKDYNVSAQLNLIGQKLTYVGNWAKQHFLSIEPADDAGLFANPYGAYYLQSGAASPALTVPFSQPTDSRAKGQSHEIRLQNDERIAGMFDYVVGYLKFKQNSPTNFQQVGTGVSFGPGQLNRVVLVPLQRYSHVEENSVFGNVNARLGEQTELSVGARHIWYKTAAGVNGCGAYFNGCANVPSLYRALKDEATIFTVSAKHNFSRDLMVYASYGTSWRPDATYIGGPTVPTAAQAQFLGTDPETSKNAEIGLKSAWLDGRLRVNITGYYQKFKNYPYRVPGPSGTGVYANDFYRNSVRGFNFITGVPVTVKGIEGDFSFDISDNWNVSGTASYSDGKIKNGSIPCNDINGDHVPDVFLSPPSAGAVSGAYGAVGVATCNVTMRANSASPFNATVQSEFSQPIGKNAEGFLRGLFSYKGNSIGDPTNAWDSVKAYGILNVYAGVRAPDGAWEVTAYAKNLANTFRVVNRSNTRNFTSVNGVNNDSTNYFGIGSTEPREFGITAKIAIGSR